MPKYIAANDITGEMGINMIQRLVLSMGYMWHPTGSVEAGIDGWIEIRDPATGEVRNATVPVQSKASAIRFEGEQDASFEYRCKERDLAYWLEGTGPVILVRSRPNTDEAYWVPVKRYFADHPDDRGRRIIRFDKEKDRFDAGCADALAALAMPRDLGIYFGPRPKVERLWSNLLPAALPPGVWAARTAYRDPAEIWRALRAVSDRPIGSWALIGQLILSFHELDEATWDQVCEPGTVERFDTGEWSDTDDPDRERMFVRLLNRALTDALAPIVRYDRDRKLYHVVPTPDLSPRTYTYRSRVEEATRTIFQGYPRSDGSGMSYYRHGAFIGRFRRLEGTWYLEIVPSYLFTRDGRWPSPAGPQLLAGIKRRERNDAVCSQVLMWAAYAAQALARAAQPGPVLGTIRTFPVESGLDDEAWRQGDETVPPLEAGEEREDAGTQSAAAQSDARGAAPRLRDRKSGAPQEIASAGVDAPSDESGEQLRLFAAPTTKYRWRSRRTRGAAQGEG